MAYGPRQCRNGLAAEFSLIPSQSCRRHKDDLASLSRGGQGAVLADAMGLGKTRLLLRARSARNP